MSDPLPGDAGARWMALMRRGEWEAAWRVSDAVAAARGSARDRTVPRHMQAVWDGTPLRGRRVLVRCYHGLGDTIQFARLLPAVQAIARDVTVWAQQALIPLLATMPDAPRLLPLNDAAPDAEFDVDIEIMELAHALRVTPETVPCRVPYLHPPAPIVQARDRLAVGIFWQAGDWDPRRSIPPEALHALDEMEGVELRVFQRGPAFLNRPEGLGVPDGSDDVLEAAGRMRALDLMIGVDSMPAHLAGALGIPVWLLLAADADWRWMQDRQDSPWYPTMRLFRQTIPGDWTQPLRRVAAALRAISARAAPPRRAGR